MKLALVPGTSNLWAADTGELFRGDMTSLRKLQKSRKRSGHGRIDIYAFGKRKAVITSRAVYSAFNGPIPAGMQIDHIDRNPRNDALSNLRLATHAENLRNRKTAVNNTSGSTGIYWESRRQLWQARIQLDGRPHHLGYFRSFDEAKTARIDAEHTYFGAFAPSSAR